MSYMKTKPSNEQKLKTAKLQNLKIKYTTTKGVSKAGYCTAVIRKKEVTAILKFWRYWYQNFQLIELYVMSYVILQESVPQMISKGSNWHFEELLVILSLFNLEKEVTAAVTSFLRINHLFVLD